LFYSAIRNKGISQNTAGETKLNCFLQPQKNETIVKILYWSGFPNAVSRITNPYSAMF
jgi:hypothetical protein